MDWIRRLAQRKNRVFLLLAAADRNVERHDKVDVALVARVHGLFDDADAVCAAGSAPNARGSV